MADDAEYLDLKPEEVIGHGFALKGEREPVSTYQRKRYAMAWKQYYSNKMKEILARDANGQKLTQDMYSLLYTQSRKFHNNEVFYYPIVAFKKRLDKRKAEDLDTTPKEDSPSPKRLVSVGDIQFEELEGPSDLSQWSSGYETVGQKTMTLLDNVPGRIIKYTKDTDTKNTILSVPVDVTFIMNFHSYTLTPMFKTISMAPGFEETNKKLSEISFQYLLFPIQISDKMIAVIFNLPYSFPWALSLVQDKPELYKTCLHSYVDTKYRKPVDNTNFIVSIGIKAIIKMTQTEVEYTYPCHVMVFEFEIKQDHVTIETFMDKMFEDMQDRALRDNLTKVAKFKKTFMKPPQVPKPPVQKPTDSVQQPKPVAVTALTLTPVPTLTQSQKNELIDRLTKTK